MGRYRLTWRPHFGGQVALGHRPGKRLRAELELSPCSLVVNLLSDEESSAAPGPSRVRLPMAGAEPPSPELDDEVRALFERITRELERGGSVYVHCSAGLHRTGMIAYAYFRHRGLSPDDAEAAIRELRELTADELRPERRAWGDRFASAGEG